MKQLKFKFDLSSSVAIYVPGTIDVNKEIDNSEHVTLVMSKLSEWFGGATASDARGGWVSPAAGLVVEKVTIIYAFCKEIDLQNRFEDIIQLCSQIRDEMKQEAVTLEVNGQIAFI